MSLRGRSTSPRPLDGDTEMENGDSRENSTAKVVVVTSLTRNVVEAHLRSIFGVYGEIAKIDLPLFGKSGQNRGKAALAYIDAASARQAASHMNGGQIDGAIVKVELSELPIRARSRSSRPRILRPARLRSLSRSRSRSLSPVGYRRRGYEPRYSTSYRGRGYGRRAPSGRERDTYRPRSRTRSLSPPPRRALNRLGPRRRSPSYERGGTGYGRGRRSRSRSYSVRSSRSRTRSLTRSRSRSRSRTRSRSRSRSPSYSYYSRYSRSRSRSRSFSRGRSRSRDDIRDSRSRSPM